jgi:hypothetical protein
VICGRSSCPSTWVQRVQTAGRRSFRSVQTSESGGDRGNVHEPGPVPWPSVFKVPSAPAFTIVVLLRPLHVAFQIIQFADDGAHFSLEVVIIEVVPHALCAAPNVVDSSENTSIVRAHRPASERSCGCVKNSC